MSSEPVHDPIVLRAISHPLRNRILSEISAAGSSRAADIARELDIPANQASFHLRQLAKYGLVEEDTAAARDKRDRVWRLVRPEGFTLNLRDVAETPGGAAAVDVYRRTLASRAQAIVASAMTDRPRDPDRHQVISDHALRLSKEEAVQMAAELDDVLTSWSERTRGRDEGRRTYLHFQVLMPYPDDL